MVELICGICATGFTIVVVILILKENKKWKDKLIKCSNCNKETIHYYYGKNYYSGEYIYTNAIWVCKICGKKYEERIEEE